MKIINVIFAPGLASYYFDDQEAIKQGAKQDGFIYSGQTQTSGYTQVRQRGESVSILLELENGQIAEGDCVAVQYSGAAGRDPLFLADGVISYLKEHLTPRLIGYDVSGFRESMAYFDKLELNGQRLHTAVRYGLSQAVLAATSIVLGVPKYDVICREWGLEMVAAPLRLFGQSGDSRYEAVDKMVLKQVDALPHGLINNIPQKLGENGGKLAEYVTWLSRRIEYLRTSESYRPALHIDVYGTIGIIFDNKAMCIADYLAMLGQRAAPFDLYIEGPADAGSQEAQISLLGEIRDALSGLGSNVKIVADEWCNTYEDVVAFVDAQCCDMVQIKTPDLGSLHNSVDAVLYCKSKGVAAYLGGTCNETDISSRACLHAAMATRPDRVLVKPGMGFDEGMMIVHNEMQRILANVRAGAEK